MYTKERNVQHVHGLCALSLSHTLIHNICLHLHLHMHTYSCKHAYICSEPAAPLQRNAKKIFFQILNLCAQTCCSDDHDLERLGGIKCAHSIQQKNGESKLSYSCRSKLADLSSIHLPQRHHSLTHPPPSIRHSTRTLQRQ